MASQETTRDRWAFDEPIYEDTRGSQDVPACFLKRARWSDLEGGYITQDEGGRDIKVEFSYSHLCLSQNVRFKTFIYSRVLLLVGHGTDELSSSHVTPLIRVMTPFCSHMTHAYMFHRESSWLPLLLVTRYYYLWVPMTQYSYNTVTHTRIVQ